MAEPSDQALYNKSKDEVDKTYDKPSAYRSMAYTRTYLKNYREKYGDDKKAYKGKNPENLKTWRKEKWIDVKSFLKDPKNPTACGNAPIKKGEYPLCMPVKQLAKYNKSELGLLVQRKNQIGKRRLVKDAFLRDVLEPEKITPIREYKDKYVKEKKNKLPEPLPKARAEKILKEKPIKEPVLKVKERIEKETPTPKVRVPKPALTQQEIDARRAAKNAKQAVRDLTRRTERQQVLAAETGDLSVIKPVRVKKESVAKPATEDVQTAKVSTMKGGTYKPEIKFPEPIFNEKGEVDISFA
jgi:hypothetical protein